MVEKKKPTIPGQDNLDIDLYGPETPSSDGEREPYPTLVSLERLASYLASYLWRDLEQINVRLPKKLIADFYLCCEEKGHHRQYAKVIGSLMAAWIGGYLQVELSHPPAKGSLRPQLEEREVRNLLQELDNSRRRGATDCYIRDTREKLAKAAKRIKLTPELEQQVRKELNL